MQVRRTKGIPPGAIGGVDTALWDLKGKALGAPVCRLMGGRYHKTLQPYGTALFYHEMEWDRLTELEEETKGLLERGFKAIKMKIGFGISRDIRRITRVREIVGDDFNLMVDANQSHSLRDALKVGCALDELGVEWFEEPMAWLSLSAYRELGNRLVTPIAGGKWKPHCWGSSSPFGSERFKSSSRIRHCAVE
jgi:D-galactarolactone cycloisomerase